MHTFSIEIDDEEEQSHPRTISEKLTALFITRGKVSERIEGF